MFRQVLDFCEELFDAGVRSPHLLSFLIDIYEEKCLKNPGDDESEGMAKKIADICQLLITTHDVLRLKYWQYVENRFKTAFERSKLNENQCRYNRFGSEDNNMQDSSETS